MAGTADKNLEQIMARIREQVRMCKPVVGTAVSPSLAECKASPYVMLLNNDVELENGSLARLVETIGY